MPPVWVQALISEKQSMPVGTEHNRQSTQDAFIYVYCYTVHLGLDILATIYNGDNG